MSGGVTVYSDGEYDELSIEFIPLLTPQRTPTKPGNIDFEKIETPCWYKFCCLYIHLSSMSPFFTK